MKRVFTVAAGDPQGPVELLAARLGVDGGEARRWLDLGAVSVGGRRIDRTSPLAPGERVVVRTPHAAPPAEAEPVVVHRDADLLAVAKPAGMLSQPSPGERATSLEVIVQRELPAARLAHRIDRDTSGLVLFTLTPAAHAGVRQALERGAIGRTYLAVVAGVLEGAREIDLRIGRDGRDGRRRIALPANAPGGAPARTRAAPLGRLEGPEGPRTALRVELCTGRTHQIRVHLQALGHPIVGDPRYGGPAGPRLLLHAWRLALPHPTSGAALALEAQLPPELADLTPWLV